MHTHFGATASRRRIALLAALALVFVALGAAPAAAHPPETFTEQVVFSGIDNPCTRLAFEAPGTVTVWIHERHDGRGIIGRTDATATSTGGYEMVSRVNRFEDNGKVFKERLRDVWEHPNGSSSVVEGEFLYNITDIVVIDRFDVICLDG